MCAFVCDLSEEETAFTAISNIEILFSQGRQIGHETEHEQFCMT